MAGTTAAAASNNLVDLAQIIGGFSTLAAAGLGAVALPIAYFEARRHKELARLDRVADAIQTYVGKRHELRSKDYFIGGLSGDEFEDVFINFDRRENTEDFLRFMQFTVERISEIRGRAWLAENRSFVDLLDSDLKELDWAIAFESIGSIICLNACKVGINELSAYKGNKTYGWDERPVRKHAGSYSPMAVKHPRMSEEEFEEYSNTDECNIRTKRNLENAVTYHRGVQEGRLKWQGILDQIRSELELAPLKRNPADQARIDAVKESDDA
ncbi:MAG: hypothetical protein JWP50_411 [Phenylobacterium sp.]|nr:hypothetical protein [Phenylobacterium sp.]